MKIVVNRNQVTRIFDGKNIMKQYGFDKQSYCNFTNHKNKNYVN